MVRIIFDGSTLRLANIDHPQQQGAGPIAYFEGLPPQRGYGGRLTMYRQRGAGIGTMMRKVWKFLRPLATSLKPVAFAAAKSIGKEGLETGSRILNEVARGGDIGEAVATEGEAGLRRLVGKAHTKLQERAAQKGSGKKRRKKKKKNATFANRIKKKGRRPPRKGKRGRKRRSTFGPTTFRGPGLLEKQPPWQLGGGGRSKGRKRKRGAASAAATMVPSDVVGKTVSQKALLKRRRLYDLGY